jgi:hypothetical protein
LEANIDQFLALVSEIELNSWWQKWADEPATFTYAMNDDGARITDVPSEPVESLLLRVRRLTMVESAENLHAVEKKAKRAVAHENVRNLYEVWHKFWRLAFIKEPYLLRTNGRSEVMTAFKVYNIFINGNLFHSDPECRVILYANGAAPNTGAIHLFLKNQFHWTVANLCVAALGLRFLITAGFPLVLSGHPKGVTDFVWCRNQLEKVDEQYRIFSDWIEKNGGCTDCRW